MAPSFISDSGPEPSVAESWMMPAMRLTAGDVPVRVSIRGAAGVGLEVVKVALVNVRLPVPPTEIIPPPVATVPEPAPIWNCLSDDSPVPV